MSIKKISVKAGVKTVGKITLESGEVIDYRNPSIENHLIETSFVQQYLNVVGLLLKLTPCAKDLVTYLTLQMDKDNLVDFHKRHKDEFIALCVRENNSRRYKIRSVDNALLELKDKFIIREIKRAYFLVNPMYYFKDEENKRYEMISLELQFFNERKEL